MEEIEAIIRHCGGYKACADATGLSINAIRKWRQNGIPDYHWWSLIAACRREGLHLSLARLFNANQAIRKQHVRQ